MKVKKTLFNILSGKLLPTAALTRLSTLFLTISMASDSRLSLISLENGTLRVKKKKTVDTESAALTLKAAYYV